MDDAARLEQVTRQLDDLIVEWERFFAGDRRVPPQGERARLSRRLRLLAESGRLRGAEAYRAAQLQHRFASYSAMWARLLRQREEGRGPMRSPRPRGGDGAPPAAVHQDDDELYERYARAWGSLGRETALDRDAFRDRLAAQRRQLEERLGRAVRFEVVSEGDSVRVKARAVDREDD